MKITKRPECELIVGGVYQHKINYPYKTRLCILVGKEKKLLCLDKFEILTNAYNVENYNYLGMAQELIIN